MANDRKGLIDRAVQSGKNTLKNGFDKANPLDQRINQNDTADHGMESLRLAYRTGKKSISTVRSAANVGKTVRKAPRVIYHTARQTVRITAATVKITTNILVHIAAAFINPVTWVVLFFALVVYVMLSVVIIIMGGASTQDATQAISYTQQVGIDDTDLDDAREFYRLACEQNKNNFSALIGGLYYDTANLRESDLVYMERNAAGAVTQYTKGYPTDIWKATLISAWTISVPETEAIAIAYVYLQTQKNSEHGTVQQIYQIEYTQEIFNQIVDTAVQWSEAIYANQTCAACNCSEHHDTQPNPAYQTALDNYNFCMERRDDFVANVVPKADYYSEILANYNSAPPAAQSAMQGTLDNAWAELVQAFQNWEYVFGYTGWAINADIGYNGSAWLNQFIDEAATVLDSTPETITTTYRTCDHQHTLHSIGLFAYDKDTVMTALGFTDADKEWANLIELGMNLDLTGGA